MLNGIHSLEFNKYFLYYFGPAARHPVAATTDVGDVFAFDVLPGPGGGAAHDTSGFCTVEIPYVSHRQADTENTTQSDTDSTSM